jgi:hypothetical protein
MATVTFFFRFICKNNGVLFENDSLQIGVKSEYRQNLERLGIFFIIEILLKVVLNTPSHLFLYYEVPTGD